jgi:hypothetical protein
VTARLLCVGFFVVHAAELTWRFHTPWDSIWACHVACLFIALGRRYAAIGVSFLMLGNPLWVLDLVSGGQLIPTSLLTHVGGLILGVRAVRKDGWPAGTWYRAMIAMALLTLVSRVTTPRAANVNLAFSVHRGWESMFPTHAHYLLFFTVLCGATFALTELIARRLPLSTETTS